MDIFSQRDPRWASVTLGQSSTTIGSHGCTITAIAMKFGVSPRFLNDRMNEVDGFAAPKDNPYEKNLVLWKKLEQALPGVLFTNRYYEFDLNRVNNSLPCVVEVDASPIGGTRHWVLYVGNEKLYDPWDGQVKPTSAYKPLSFTVLDGQYKRAEASTPTTPVQPGNVDPQYVAQLEKDREKFWKERDAALAEIETLKKQLVHQKENQSEDPNYTELKAHGYVTLADVNKVIEGSNVDCKDTKKKLIDALDDNVKLHQMLGEKDRMDNEVLKQSLNALEENKALKDDMAEVIKAVGATKPKLNIIIDKILFFREQAEKNLQKVEVKEEATVEKPKKSGPSGLEKLVAFLTLPSSQEVNKSK